MLLSLQLQMLPELQPPPLLAMTTSPCWPPRPEQPTARALLPAWGASGRMTARHLCHVRVQRLCWALALPWRAAARTRLLACRRPLRACLAAGLARARRRRRAEHHQRQRAVHAVRAALQVLRCHHCCTWGSTRSVRRPGRHARALLPLRPGLRRHRAQRLHPRGRAVLAQSPAVQRAALLAAGVSLMRRRTLASRRTLRRTRLNLRAGRAMRRVRAAKPRALPVVTSGAAQCAPSQTVTSWSLSACAPMAAAPLSGPRRAASAAEWASTFWAQSSTRPLTPSTGCCLTWTTSAGSRAYSMLTWPWQRRA